MTDEDNCPYLSTPETDPKVVTEFNVTLLPPVAGCMDLEIRCDGELSQIWTSYIYPPFEKMKAWLEAIALGEAAELHIDPEGGMHHLYVTSFTRQSDWVRYSSWLQTDGFNTFRPHLPIRKTVIKGQYGEWVMTGSVDLTADVVMPRRQFVSAFYNGLLAQWEKPTPELFWREWDNTTPEWYKEDGVDEATGQPYGAWHFSMQSDIIDRFLAEGAQTSQIS
ncbi:hypothetical protein [Asticcacaulis solisilvae]|uniref:hypothetical protein n=1 Tax=Asticcacaulis solisilvae TaxID=1217274 RepID=UPI003FD7E732